MYFGFRFTFVSAGAGLSYQAATDALVTDQFLAKEDEGASCWQPSSDQFKVFKIRFSKSENIMRFKSESVEGLGWLGWLLVRVAKCQLCCWQELALVLQRAEDHRGA